MIMKCYITLNPARNLKSNTNFGQFNFVGTLQASIFWFIVLCALMFQSFLPDVDLNSNCSWIKSWYLSRFEERNFCTDLKNVSNFILNKFQYENLLSNLGCLHPEYKFSLKKCSEKVQIQKIDWDFYFYKITKIKSNLSISIYLWIFCKFQ